MLGPVFAPFCVEFGPGVVLLNPGLFVIVEICVNLVAEQPGVSSASVPKPIL
jgi:hypothetical protein